jgi:hypothetical protein
MMMFFFVARHARGPRVPSHANDKHNQQTSSSPLFFPYHMPKRASLVTAFSYSLIILILRIGILS